MAQNTFDDNVTLWAASLNTLVNGIGGQGIASGAVISKGTGDWETDVTAGTIVTNDAEVSVSSATVTHSDTSTMVSGESRIDLVIADESTGAVSIIEGTAASAPASPDITGNDVLLGFWHIDNGDSTLGDSDRFVSPQSFNDESVLYENGGVSELDAGTLDGSGGTSGQYLTTDGSAASWSGLSVDSSVPSDVSGSRSLDTWYQNTNGTALVVYVIPDGTYTVHVNSSQTANQVFGNSNDGEARTFIVGDQDYYRVNAVGATGITSWTEATLQ